MNLYGVTTTANLLWLENDEPDSLSVRRGVRVTNISNSLATKMKINPTTWNNKFYTSELKPAEITVEVWVKPACSDCSDLYGVDVDNTGDSASYIARYITPFTTAIPKIGTVIAGFWSPIEFGVSERSAQNLVGVQHPELSNSRSTDSRLGTYDVDGSTNAITDNIGETGNFVLGTGYVDAAKKGLRFFTNSQYVMMMMMIMS